MKKIPRETLQDLARQPSRPKPRKYFQKIFPGFAAGVSKKVLERSESPRHDTCWRLSGGIRAQFRLRFQMVKVLIFGGFPVQLENPTNKASASKLFQGEFPYLTERFRVRLRRLSEHGSLLTLLKTNAGNTGRTVLRHRALDFSGLSARFFPDFFSDWAARPRKTFLKLSLSFQSRGPRDSCRWRGTQHMQVFVLGNKAHETSASWQYTLLGYTQDDGKGGFCLRGVAFMTVLVVLMVLAFLESTLPSFCLVLRNTVPRDDRGRFAGFSGCGGFSCDGYPP